jgi:RNA recognition motif-containing protein
VKEADAKGKYGFVHMSTPDEASTCLHELKGAYIRDVAINVEISEDKKKSRDGDRRDDRGSDRMGRGGGRSGHGGGGPVKLFIGNMNENITSDDLKKLFGRAGTVTECAAKGRYGFVHMASWDEAQNAIRLCNRHQLKGQTLNVEESQGGGSRGGGGGGGYGGRDFGYDDYGPSSRGGGGGGRNFGDTTVKVFIGNLTEKTTTEDLIALFSRYGRVKESDSQACGKFGFIHMFYMEDAERAIYELNGTTLNGVRLNVELSQKGDKGGGGGGGPDRRGRSFQSRRDERPYDRPPRGGMDGPPRDAMAVADYYQRHGRLPPADEPLDRPLPSRDAYSSYSAMYERERMAYDAYRATMAARDPYRDPYTRATAEYRTSADPFVRPPPEVYGSSAAKRFEEYDRIAAARDRDYPVGAGGVAQVTGDRFSLTPEAAYAISRFAEADRYRAAATDSAAVAARGAANGASDPYSAASGGSYSTGAYSSLYYGAR